MKRILLLGAGRSATILIQYLLENAAAWNASITIADRSIDQARKKTGSHEQGLALALDVTDDQSRREVIGNHDLVISLLPPSLHISVAKDCITLRKHLVTASYVSEEMQQLNEDVKKAGLLFMCEMGLDPGIDHMSAMKMIEAIQAESGIIISFKSGTGGLIAPESDTNPWHYKITWNPRNVVLAGLGTARFLQNGREKYIPYHRLFTSTEKFKIKGWGKFESYANRDSLPYIDKYNLKGIQTLLRSTIRREGFCEAWNALVQLGLTDDSFQTAHDKALTYAQWVASFLPGKKKEKKRLLRDQVARFLQTSTTGKLIERLEWMGLFSDQPIQTLPASPAQILQELLLDKWPMQEEDKDLVVMRHELIFRQSGTTRSKTSTLVFTGSDAQRTAMATTVGLPLGMMVKLILDQQLFLTGVHIPVMSQVYQPVLRELETFGIRFEEQEEVVKDRTTKRVRSPD